MFGNWRTTTYCSDTCGSNSYKLKTRSCTPSSPNLPEGSSCASIPEHFTLTASSVEKCDLDACKGKILSERKCYIPAKATGGNGLCGASAQPTAAWESIVAKKKGRGVSRTTPCMRMMSKSGLVTVTALQVRVNIGLFFNRAKYPPPRLLQTRA